MSTPIQFMKMHGLGNDFIVIDAINQAIKLTPALIRQWADRHTGIGFDQCLLVEKPLSGDHEFFYRIYNADGTEVSQCGNGARCLAIFIKHHQLTNKSAFTVATHSSRLTLTPLAENSAQVEFPAPNFSPKAIPLNQATQAEYYPLEVQDTVHYLHALSVGNPHGILFVDELTDELITSLGKPLSYHPAFVEGANISFAKLISKNTIEVRIYERGAGITQACGSAALATMACARLFHHCEAHMTIRMPGGELHVQWQGLGYPMYLTGPAVSVFEGTIIP